MKRTTPGMLVITQIVLWGISIYYEEPLMIIPMLLTIMIIHTYYNDIDQYEAMLRNYKRILSKESEEDG